MRVFSVKPRASPRLRVDLVPCPPSAPCCSWQSCARGTLCRGKGGAGQPIAVDKEQCPESQLEGKIDDRHKPSCRPACMLAEQDERAGVKSRERFAVGVNAAAAAGVNDCGIRK